MLKMSSDKHAPSPAYTETSPVRLTRESVLEAEGLLEHPHVIAEQVTGEW